MTEDKTSIKRELLMVLNRAQDQHEASKCKKICQSKRGLEVNELRWVNHTTHKNYSVSQSRQTHWLWETSKYNTCPRIYPQGGLSIATTFGGTADTRTAWLAQKGNRRHTIANKQLFPGKSSLLELEYLGDQPKRAPLDTRMMVLQTISELAQTTAKKWVTKEPRQDKRANHTL